jgi:hypothetical protein
MMKEPEEPCKKLLGPEKDPELYKYFPHATRERYPTFSHAVVCSLVFFTVESALVWLAYSIPVIHISKPLLL